MSQDSQEHITRILSDLEAGKESAKDRLFAVAFGELRELADRVMRRESAAHTLQPTALVNEAALRFLKVGELQHHESRGLFFWTMARAMRQVLVDHARKRKALRRGGEFNRVDLEDVGQFGDAAVDVLALDEALDELQTRDPRQARLVELRFFGGYEMKEIAEQMDVSLSTVEKDWRLARAWLRGQLGGA